MNLKCPFLLSDLEAEKWPFSKKSVYKDKIISLFFWVYFLSNFVYFVCEVIVFLDMMWPLFSLSDLEVKKWPFTKQSICKNFHVSNVFSVLFESFFHTLWNLRFVINSKLPLSYWVTLRPNIDLFHWKCFLE